VSRKARPAAELLDLLYRRYNDLRWLSADPLEVVLEYRRPADQELAALVCASLALGSAPLIVKAARHVLYTVSGKSGGLVSGPSLRSIVLSKGSDGLLAALDGFRYRFFTGADIAALLYAAASLSKQHTSLESAFLAGFATGDSDYVNAASAFVRALRDASPWPFKTSLLPDPLDGSAAKRTFLYLRWMVRSDSVDPGTWKRAEPSRLIVPLDTHMAAACRRLGFLSRKSTDLAAAREATLSLKAFCPHDPLRFDFCMTRPGIHPELDPDECFG